MGGNRFDAFVALPALVPDRVPGFGQPSLDGIQPVGARAAQEILDLAAGADFHAFAEALGRVGNCSRPVRLLGSSRTLDRATGEVIGSYSSTQEPLGVTLVPCGNRRASVCPACSRVYAGDAFQVIRAGVVGGKTVPASVAENPLVFATLTAPSFGHVHTRRSEGRVCRGLGADGEPRCRHGRPRGCYARHTEDDSRLGEPLCRDCYDYASQVVWQWWAPDLWRRFTITLRRLVAHELGVPAARVGGVATVQYAKVAEFQRRGAVHFHALVRLDGPRCGEGFGASPRSLDARVLAELVRRAATSVRLTVPGVDQDDQVRVLAFGRQVDVRPVCRRRRTDDFGEALSPEQVAGYLAKYATKAADEDAGYDSVHHRRIRTVTRSLAERAGHGDGPYDLLGKWVPMLGFRGHFASTSRRYSITLGSLRRARRRARILLAQAQAAGKTIDLAAREAELMAAGDDTTLVIGQWTYAGTGWRTDGQRALAVAAAARARERQREEAEERRSIGSRQKEAR